MDWRVEWRNDPKRFIGLPLDVLLVDDKTRHAGKIVRLESIDVLGETVDGYPVIRLDDGREVGGMECWWIPANEVAK